MSHCCLQLPWSGSSQQQSGEEQGVMDTFRGKGRELTRYVETFLLLEEVVQYWNRYLGRLGNCQPWTNSEVM